jgi:hypothetical protein
MSVKFLVIGTGNAIVSVHNSIKAGNRSMPRPVYIVSVHNSIKTATAACEKHNRAFPAFPAIVAESNTTICGCKAGDVAVTVSDVEADVSVAEETVSYIAKPTDDRCAWWSMQLPADIELSGEKIQAPYLRKGADLDLKSGDMIIDSEENHYRKNRGYTVLLIVCVDGKVNFIIPTARIKSYIKNNGGKDLMHESGDVAGCVRMAVWLRRQSNLSIAVKQLLTA